MAKFAYVLFDTNVKPMANPHPKYKIPKGLVLNPRGAGAHSEEKRAFSRLTLKELLDVYSLILKGTEEDLLEILDDPKETILKRALVRGIVSDSKAGRTDTIERLLDRVIGKPKVQIELPPDPGAQLETITIELVDAVKLDPE